MRKNTIKMKGKKALSMLLALVITLSVIAPAASAATFTATSNNNHKAIIAVPETVYMTPSTGNSTTGQYYVNNTITDNNGSYSLSTDAVNNAGAGNVQYYIPGATNVKISATNVTSGGTVTLNGVSTSVNAASYTGSLNDIVVSAGIAASGTALIEWKFEATVGGSTRTYYAYSTLYAPYLVPVGAATKVKAEATGSWGKDNTVFSQTIGWISGVHSITSSDSRGSAGYKPNLLSSSQGKGMLGFLGTDNSAYVGTNKIQGVKGSQGDMYAVYASTTAANSYFFAGQSGSVLNGDESAEWFNASSTLGVNSFDYNSRSQNPNSNYLSVLCYSRASGNITIDTSRYTNLNQIPNLGVGLLVTDNDRGDRASWYIADFSDTYTNGKLTDYWQSNKGDSTRYYSEHTTILGGQANNNNYSDYDSGLSTSYKGSGLKYTGSWNRDLKSGSSAIYTMKTFHGSRNDNSTHALSYTFTDMHATQINKSALRQLVIEGTGLNPSNYTSTSWNNYQTELRNAAKELGNPTSTNTATQALTDARNALQTTVTLNANGGSIGTTSFNVTVGNATTYNYNVASYTPTRAGYTFKGWATSSTATSGSTTTVNAGLMPTLYATWEANKYNVTFDNLFDFSKFEFGKGTVRIEQETDTGFTVSSTAEDGNTGFSYAIPVEPGKTYIFSADVEFTPVSGGYDMYIQTLDGNYAGETTATPISTGARREGDVYITWSGQTDNGNRSIKFTAGSNTKYIKIRFDVNAPGNVLTVNNIRIYEEGTVADGVSYEPPKTVTYNGTYGELPTPTRPGYEFLGWYKADGSSAPASTDKVTITDTLNLYSKWKALNYTVKFNGNGATSGADTSVNVAAGQSYTIPANWYIKTGYTFKEWHGSDNKTYADKATISAIDPGTTLTLTAQWTANQYSYTFKNGDTVVSTGNYTIEGGIIVPAALSKTGYTFNGWKVEAAVENWGKGEVASTGSGKIGNVTFVADWTEHTYNIAYNGNGATDGSTAGATGIKYTAETTIAANGFTRPGYNFVGWSTDKNATTGDLQPNAVVSKLTAENGATVTLYAVWDAIEGTITFDANGGTAIDPIENYDYTTDITLPTPAERTGYTFAGWKVESQDGNWTVGQTITELAIGAGHFGSVTLTAQWTAITYNIVFNGNGNTSGGNMSNHTKVKYDDNVTLNDNKFARTGYTFEGWNTEADGSGTSYTNGETVNNLTTTDGATVNLYAQWKATEFTLKYVNNGEETSIKYTVETKLTIDTPAPRLGYTFGGWKVKSVTGSHNWTKDEIIDAGTQLENKRGNVTLEAQWTKDEYKLTFVEGIGSDVEDITYDIDTPVTIPSLSKTGYEFKGWIVSDATGMWENGATVNAGAAYAAGTAYGSATLTAQWEIINYTIVYNTNGGDAISDATYTVEAPATIPTPEREGYTFTGWTIESTDGDWTVVDGAVAGTYGNVKLKANWTAINGEIIFVTDGSEVSNIANYTYTSEIELPTTEKVGYTFNGWLVTPNAENGGNWISGQLIKPDELNIGAGHFGTATLTAQWTANTYTVKFDANGAEGKMDDQTFTYDEAQKLNANTFSKTGYTFAGWLFDGKTYADKTEVTNLATEGTVTLTAKWTANTYTIEFNAGTGTGEMTEMSMTYDEAKNLTANGFTKTGYTFAGWKDAEGKTYVDKESVSNLTAVDGETITLTAQWTVNTYNYIFNDGTSDVATGTYTINDVITAPEAPSKTGFTFKGWKVAETVENWTAGESVSTEAGKYGNVTFVADWEAVEYTITYNLAEGQMPDDNYTKTYTIEDTVNLPVPVRPSYSFTGWTISNNDGDWTVADDGTVTGTYGNVTLTANWKIAEYYITYKVNGEQYGEVVKYQPETAVTVGSEPNVAPETGYEFGGWKVTKTEGDWELDSIIPADSNVGIKYGSVTLEAYWKPIEYTATFVDGDKTVGTDTYTIEGGLDIPVVTVPTGYHLDYWFTESGGEGWTAGDKATSETTGKYGDVTFEVVWAANTYAIEFNANGGTGEMAEMSMTYNAGEVALTANGFSKTGYTFAGWATEANGEVVYADKATVSNLTAENGAIVTLYAVWTANTYIVKFDANGAEGEMADQTFTYDAEQSLNELAFSKTGYSFAGWTFEGKTYNDKAVVSNLAESGEITLTAQWTINKYTLIFDENGGTDVNDIVVYTITDAVTIPEISREGYTFAGWLVTTADGSWTADREALFAGALEAGEYGSATLTAQWTANTYTIEFVGGEGAEGATTSMTMKYDETKALTANAFTKTGYKFTGWVSGENTYTDAQEVKNLTAENGATVTLTAQWTPITYTIVFNANGGLGEMASMTMTYDQAKNLDANKFTRDDDLVFYSWNTEANGTGTSYKDGVSVSNLATTEGATVTLYAIWRSQTYYITYDVGYGKMPVEGTYTTEYTNVDPITLPAPTRSGFTFVGWKVTTTTNSKSWTGTYKDVYTFEPGTKIGDVTLNAQWALISESLRVADDNVAVDFYSDSIVIDVLKNDALFCDDARDDGIAVSYVQVNTSGSTTGSSYTDAATVSGKYGAFSVVNKKIVYTPKSTEVGVEEIKLKIRTSIAGATSGNTSGGNYYTILTIAPASNVYYEESVIADNSADNKTVNKDGTAGNNPWTLTGSAPVELIADTSATDVYGYDKSYDNENEFSNGSYLKADVTSSAKKSVTKLFNFEGSGFDLISACGKTTGVQVVKVSQWDDVQGKYVAKKSYIVDTFFSDTAIMSNGLLHQVPIVNYRALDSDGNPVYGKYQVEITASYLSSAAALKKSASANLYNSAVTVGDGITLNTAVAEPSQALINEVEGLGIDLGEDVELVWFDDNSVLNGGTGAKGTRLSGSANVFFSNGTTTLANYIDGFRVYNPLNGTNSDASYIASEKNFTYYNIVNDLADGKNEKFVYIESGELNFDKEGIDFDAYNNHGGPKGEIYLKGGQGIAFKFSAQAVGGTAGVMLGMRAVYGSPVAKVNTGYEKELTSKTEMYYDVSEYVSIKATATSVTITVVNNGPEDSVLAVNNLKLVNGELTSEGSGTIQSGSNTIIGGNVGVPTPVVPQVNVAQGNAIEGNAPETVLPEEEVTENVPETEVEENMGDVIGDTISGMIPGIPTSVMSFLEMLFKLLSQFVGTMGF